MRSVTHELCRKPCIYPDVAFSLYVSFVVLCVLLIKHPVFLLMIESQIFVTSYLLPMTDIYTFSFYL